MVQTLDGYQGGNFSLLATSTVGLGERTYIKLWKAKTNTVFWNTVEWLVTEGDDDDPYHTAARVATGLFITFLTLKGAWALITPSTPTASQVIQYGEIVNISTTNGFKFSVVFEVIHLWILCLVSAVHGILEGANRLLQAAQTSIKIEIGGLTVRLLQGVQGWVDVPQEPAHVLYL
ncbi:hypothetical protein BDN67DRAFT_1017429 [Paxillus ammoniavirescens]|nr:hypothetical protein BDN67DRAFT_1017429 [Paxillus ammoniavirescens]